MGVTAELMIAAVVIPAVARIGIHGSSTSS